LVILPPKVTAGFPPDKLKVPLALTVIVLEKVLVPVALFEASVVPLEIVTAPA